MVPKNCDDGVNVGILDNDACALEMMRLLLQRSGSSMHVVWTGMTAQRTLERVTFEQSADSLSKANVLVMNLALNGISGVDVYRQIRCRNASLGIVGVNSYPLDQYRQQLASAGAQGLFSRRDIFSPAFAKAIREVASGNAPIARAIFFQRENLMSIFASFPKKTNGLFPSENSTYFLCIQKD